MIWIIICVESKIPQSISWLMCVFFFSCRFGGLGKTIGNFSFIGYWIDVDGMKYSSLKSILWLLWYSRTLQLSQNYLSGYFNHPEPSNTSLMNTNVCLFGYQMFIPQVVYEVFYVPELTSFWGLKIEDMSFSIFESLRVGR